jgi:hypothetical protein
LGGLTWPGRLCLVPSSSRSVGADRGKERERERSRARAAARPAGRAEGREQSGGWGAPLRRIERERSSAQRTRRSATVASASASAQRGKEGDEASSAGSRRRSRQGSRVCVLELELGVAWRRASVSARPERGDRGERRHGGEA